MSDNASIALPSFIDLTISQAFGDLYAGALIFEKFFTAITAFLPFLVAYIFYEYIEYLVIIDAYNYEQSMKKRYSFIRRMAYRLEQLSKEYGDFYFCYLPMNHGLRVPPTYTLFQAIKEVLNKNNRPACRRICLSIILELAQFDYIPRPERLLNDRTPSSRENGACGSEIAAVDSLSDFNLNIMQFTREMVIFGVKDLEIMATLHHLIEAILQDF